MELPFASPVLGLSPLKESPSSLFWHHRGCICKKIKEKCIAQVLLSMDELMGRRLLCGNGTGTQLVGRVKIDFACLQVLIISLGTLYLRPQEEAQISNSSSLGRSRAVTQCTSFFRSLQNALHAL